MALESRVRARAHEQPPRAHQIWFSWMRCQSFSLGQDGVRGTDALYEWRHQADRHSSEGQNPDRTNSAKPKELFVWPSNWCIGHRGRKTHSLSTYCVPGSGLNCLHTWSHLTSQKSCIINACVVLYPLEIKNKQTEAQRKQVCFRLNNQSQVEVSNLGLSDVNACVF